MGEDEATSEIFEIEDKLGHKLLFCLIEGHGKTRILQINESDCSEFIITKPLARKIIEELKEEFKI